MSFRARYPGRCPECAGDIEVGDLLETGESDRVVHITCVDGDPSEPRPVCPRCFTEKAVNGACACDPEDQDQEDAA